MVMAPSSCPLLLLVPLMGKNTRCPFFTVATASCFLARRVKKCRSLSPVWSMCSTLMAARPGSTRGVRLFCLAMVSTMAPMVVSCQLFSLRVRISRRISAALARMLMRSGAPWCSTSSTSNVPLSTSPRPSQPRRSASSAPFFGRSRAPSLSSSSMSSWSASSPRDSVRVRLINRASALMARLMSRPFTVSW